MDYKSKLNQIKALLGLEVKLEQMTLENGTVIEAEMFEAGQPVFIVTEDGQVPLPIGDYMLPEGRMLVVSEDGMIGEIKDAAAEAETPEVEVEVEASEETPEYVTKAEFISKMDEIISMFSAITTEKEETKVEMSAEELMPAAKAIKPNPEKEAAKKIEFKTNNKSRSVESNVMAKISKIKK